MKRKTKRKRWRVISGDLLCKFGGVGIYDAENSWRVISELDTHPNGDVSNKELARAIVDFLNEKYPRND